MNVLLLTDMEGIPGLTSIAEMERGTDLFRTSCRKLEDCINFCGGFLLENGADRVYYLDGHGGGGNVDPERIDPRLVRITLPEWDALLRDKLIDFQVELGAHARPGTVGGFLDHTLNSRRIYTVTVNGREMSELSLHALLCSAYGVPVACCIGDKAACEQAREYIPGLPAAAVKTAAERNECEPAQDAEESMRHALKEALLGYRSLPLYSVTAPFTLEYTYYRTDFCEEALHAALHPDVVRVGARTLRRTVPRIECYNDLKC